MTPPTVPIAQPGGRALLLALLTGSLLAVCQVDLQWLAWVALAPLTLACVGRRPLAGAALGFVAGLLAGSALYGVASYGLITYGMLVVYCGVHMAAYGFVIARAGGRVHRWLDLVLPALAWTSFEVLRRVGDNSFPINLSATQIDLLPLLQIARWTGGHGVSFLIALPAGLLVVWAREARFPRGMAAAVALLLVTSTGYGCWRLARAEVGGTPLRVAGVQTAFQNWLYSVEVVSPEHRALIHRSLFALTEQAAKGGAELIVWPETALHEQVLGQPELKGRLHDLTRQSGASVLAGFFREDERGLEHNSAVLFTPDGKTAFYDKRRLAGLAEWRMTPGTRPGLLASPHGPLGVLICLESVYPQDAAALVRGGAEVLVVTTNDAGFRYSPMADFHGNRSALTAIESDRWLLHLSQAGPSTLLDPLGRAVVRSRLFEAELVSGVANRRTTRTPYQRFGEWFPALLFLCLAGSLGAPTLVRRGLSNK